MKASAWICSALCASASLFVANFANAQTGYAVDSTGLLYSFNVATPGATTSIGSLGFVPAGIDFRGDTGVLYAFRVTATNAQLYTVSLTTGVATALPNTIALTGSGTGGTSGTVASSYTLSSTANYGFDVNPKTRQADGSIRIRVVDTNGGADLRLNSTTGSVANVDPALTYGTGAGTGTPSIVGSAYLNNIVETAGTPGIGATTLYNVSDTTNSLYTQTPPNDGVLTTPLLLTLNGTTVDVQALAGFDIYTTAAGVNTAYLATNGDGVAGTEFYTVNLSTGATALVGNFNSSLNIVDIAILPVPEPSTYALLGLGAAALLFGTMRRRKMSATA